jgi:hypothetical protein
MKAISTLIFITFLSCNYTWAQNPRVTLPCAICILNDSLVQLKNHIAELESLDMPAEYWKNIFAKLDSTRDSLESKFGLKSEYDYHFSNQIATDSCLAQNPLNQEIDELQQTQLLKLYLAFSAYNRLPRLVSRKLDTSDYRMSSSHFIVMVEGEEILINKSEIETYWTNILSAYDKINEIIRSRVDSSSTILLGSPVQELSKTKYAVLRAHSRITQKYRNEIDGILNADYEYQKALSDFQSAIRNKNKTTPNKK